MIPEVTQLISLVSWGNACLKGKISPEDVRNPAINFSEYFSFREDVGGRLLADVASSPVDWLKKIKEAGCLRLELDGLLGRGIYMDSDNIDEKFVVKGKTKEWFVRAIFKDYQEEWDVEWTVPMTQTFFEIVFFTMNEKTKGLGILPVVDFDKLKQDTNGKLDELEKLFCKPSVSWEYYFAPEIKEECKDPNELAERAKSVSIGGNKIINDIKSLLSSESPLEDFKKSYSDEKVEFLLSPEFYSLDAWRLILAGFAISGSNIVDSWNNEFRKKYDCVMKDLFLIAKENIMAAANFVGN